MNKQKHPNRPASYEGKMAGPVLTHMRAVAYTPVDTTPFRARDDEAAKNAAQAKRDRRAARNKANAR